MPFIHDAAGLKEMPPDSDDGKARVTEIDDSVCPSVKLRDRQPLPAQAIPRPVAERGPGRAVSAGAAP